ncbi:hypothetical protein AGR13a_Lc90032 [Agrobacterium genomosp. 13 str. CFBP 6927]|uniref:Uncharacterized protein n=1 Tax=Agrobacterium genomosp. 13 str. CFBP 6927 TaxID=1183428 RepID=A0ABP2BQ44_9HYPH|nr:hypothetical protein AGR13a_Lc90032 [Agrobacterium genomosp. 13 str. CFBP 6927]
MPRACATLRDSEKMEVRGQIVCIYGEHFYLLFLKG